MLNSPLSPDDHSFVATLISDPIKPILTPDLVDKALRTVNATAVYWLSDGIACDILLPRTVQMQTIHKMLREAIGFSSPVDIVVQPMENRRKKLLLADMDSTMIREECIDELAEEANLHRHVADVTSRAMNGEIDFEVALRERVSLLKNLPLALIDTVLKRITLTPGALVLVHTMHKNSAYTALISGGFTLFTKKVASIIGFDESSANILEHNGRSLSGLVREPILGKKAKLKKLLDLCVKLDIPLAATIAVGDGANDLSMLQHAGSGVAFHAKSIVREATSMHVDYGDLTALLYIQGYRKVDFVT